jgi:hypothetical protein
MNELFKKPDALLPLGFIVEEEATSDLVRWVWYRKQIDFGNTGFYIVITVTYERTIPDYVGVSYAENVNDYFENLTVAFYDENDELLAKNKPQIKRLEELNDINILFN